MPPLPLHVIYAAKGQRYVEEAVQSVQRARRTLDDRYRFSLVCDIPIEVPAFDRVLVVPEADPYLFKVKSIIQFPEERYVFLDTDTMVVGDFTELYEMLDRFDICVRPEVLFSPAIFEEDEVYARDVPISFPEFNTGVIAVRRSAATLRMFEMWWKRTHHDIAESGRRPFTNEQLGFRWALYHSEARYASLEAPYNLTYCFSQDVFGPVKIVHGRERPELMQAVAENINRHDKMRLLVYTHQKDGQPSSVTLNNIHMQRIKKYFFDPT